MFNCETTSLGGKEKDRSTMNKMNITTQQAYSISIRMNQGRMWTKEISISTHWPPKIKTIVRPGKQHGFKTPCVKKSKITTKDRISRITKSTHSNHHNSSTVNVLTFHLFCFQLPAVVIFHFIFVKKSIEIKKKFKKKRINGNTFAITS